ncbi:hypothetical protein B0H21DRAFT_123778 [Amylocystis lapponica]|nr:hypothetical protein B0H21DRAFT_123778 [Amylocystis lapponica]
MCIPDPFLFAGGLFLGFSLSHGLGCRGIRNRLWCHVAARHYGSVRWHMSLRRRWRCDRARFGIRVRFSLRGRDIVYNRTGHDHLLLGRDRRAVRHGGVERRYGSQRRKDSSDVLQGLIYRPAAPKLFERLRRHIR